MYVANEKLHSKEAEKKKRKTNRNKKRKKKFVVLVKVNGRFVITLKQIPCFSCVYHLKSVWFLFYTIMNSLLARAHSTKLQQNQKVNSMLPLCI